MNRKQALLIVCSVLLATCTIFAQAPADPNLLYVSVEVFQPGNMPVTGLKKENFNVLEDRMAQTIVVFEEGADRGSYRIGYSPTNAAKDGNWRSIRVNFSDPTGSLGKVTVRFKSGYYAR